VPKLKNHLLPRLQDLLKYEAPAQNAATAGGNDPEDYNHVFIKKDVMYRHKIAHINYTTYDVRRAQDVIHVDTLRCNVMVFNNPEDDDENPFSYARVIGIFHVNAILAGPEGIVDHRPRRLEFLWVRWYRCVSAMHTWETGKLDRIHFPPITDEDAFGFLDPRDILRASHITPIFALGQVHVDGIGLSKIAKDYQDWRFYYITRYVRR